MYSNILLLNHHYTVNSLDTQVTMAMVHKGSRGGLKYTTMNKYLHSHNYFLTKANFWRLKRSSTHHKHKARRPNKRIRTKPALTAATQLKYIST